jgi:hypothetical protein
VVALAAATMCAMECRSSDDSSSSSSSTGVYVSELGMVEV